MLYMMVEILYLLLKPCSSNELLYEYFNSKTFTGGDWICNNGAVPIYQCQYGMSLVQLASPQTLIQRNIVDIPPHYQIQLLVDVYAFFTIDGAESAIIYADSGSLAYNSPGANGKHYFNQCGSTTETMEIQTKKLDISHSTSTLLIKIQTTVDEIWPNEGYPIRNLQVFYSKCYKTCQTCNGETFNNCLTCFTIAGPISGTCNNCMNEINKRFLLNTQGCIQECPTGYIYNQNSEFICQQNLKLINHLQLNYIQPMTTQDLILTSTLVITRTIITCSGTLAFFPYYQNELLYKSLSFSSITTTIRIRATFIIFGNWISPQAIQILFDNNVIDQILITGITVIPSYSILLYSDQIKLTCSTFQYFTFRIELIQKIPSSNFQIQFQSINLSGMTEFWSITQLDIEELICALNCQICKNQFACQTCQPSYYLHKGECINVCPAYSTQIGNECIDFDEEYIDGREHTRIQYLVKEFYDVSTSIDRINQLFTLQTSSANNFAKGSDIYFSYMPDKRVFGGALVWVDAKFKFSLNLPQYYHQIRIRFQAVLGDNFQGQFLYTINNGNQVTITTATLNPIIVSQVWGDIFNEHIFQIDETIQSENLIDNLPIIFQCSNPGISVNQAFCAIQNMFITAIYYCPTGYILDEYRYDMGLYPCISICGDGLTNDEEECDDGNNIPFDGCYNCRYSCEDQCQFCLQGQCLVDQCDQDERFDIGVSKSCETYCTNNSILCVICDCQTKYDSFLEQYEQQTCQFECNNCNQGICIECLDNYSINIITNTCDSICGDFIINGSEECDDGNLDPNDGCHNCKYVCDNYCKQSKLFLLPYSIFDQICACQINTIQSLQFDQCQIECLTCNYGKCFNCQENYFLNQFTNTCNSFCGDSIINGNEECDDGNNYIFDGCDQCKLIKYDLCNNKCSFCYYGVCLSCNYGYFLQDNKCLSICGDNLVNKDLDEGYQIEECDNPNIDGCDNCKINSGFSCIQQDISICWTCDLKCTQCVNVDDKLQCYQCIEGYYPSGSECLLCDDNCITCYQESEMCTSCYRDDCQLCENIEGLYTDRDQKKCISQCGDGIKIKYLEQCDDGNLDEGDGCDSQCNLEDSLNYNTTIDVIRYKGDNSNDLSISNSLQISYSCTDVQVSIDEFQQTDFSFIRTSTDNSCEIDFTFLKSIHPYNIIHIKITYTLTDTRLLTDQMIKEINVSPVEQIILSSDQQSQVDQIANAQSSFSYLLLIIAPLSILFGVFEYFWAVLEVLSWINNFYFLNVSWPFNVQVLFLKSDWSSIVNFPTYQGFNQKGCDYYFESPPKFMDKNTDPLFINNAQVPFGFIAFSIIFYLVSLIFLKFAQIINNLLKKNVIKKTRTTTIFKMDSYYTKTTTEQNLKTQNSIFFKKVPNKYAALIENTLENITNQFHSRIKLTITLCFLDISMAITLQLLYASEFQHIVIFINEILALSSALLVCYQLYQSFSILNIHSDLAECPQFQLKYGCYYEGVNVESPFGLVYNFTGLIRKILYIFSTVYFYYNPLLQTSLCFLTCGTGVILMLYSNPFETKRMLLQQLISEGCVSVVVFITVLFAINDQSTIFSDETKIQLGWLLIAVILLALVCEILTLFYEILSSLYQTTYKIYKFIQKQYRKKNEKQQKSKDAQIAEQMETKSISPYEKPRFHPVNGRLHFIQIRK